MISLYSNVVFGVMIEPFLGIVGTSHFTAEIDKITSSAIVLPCIPISFACGSHFGSYLEFLFHIFELNTLKTPIMMHRMPFKLYFVHRGAFFCTKKPFWQPSWISNLHFLIQHTQKPLFWFCFDSCWISLSMSRFVALLHTRVYLE